MWHRNRKELVSEVSLSVNSLCLKRSLTGDSPPAIAPEQGVGPPSPLCAGSQSTPTGATEGHWVSCWTVTYHSGQSFLPLKARRHFYVHIDIRGSDHRPCRGPAGSSQMWMASVASMLAGERYTVRCTATANFFLVFENWVQVWLVCYAVHLFYIKPSHNLFFHHPFVLRLRE